MIDFCRQSTLTTTDESFHNNVLAKFTQSKYLDSVVNSGAYSSRYTYVPGFLCFIAWFAAGFCGELRLLSSSVVESCQSVCTSTWTIRLSPRQQQVGTLRHSLVCL